MFMTMFIGNLGADATHQVLQDGKTVINFNVAVTKKYKDQQGNTNEKTTWIGVSYWPRNNNINVLSYLLKGTQVFVQGEITARPYRGADGKLHAALNLSTHQVQLLGGKKQDAAQQNGQHQAPPAIPSAADITEPLDDLPF